MPWPLVPPDVDFPSPTRRDPDHEWFATRVETSGLVPFKEQASLRLSVAGGAASAWLPVHRSMGVDRYAGVVISKLPSEQLDAAWLDDGGRKRSYSLNVQSVTQQDVELKTVKVSGTSTKISVTVVASGAPSGAFVVVAPFAEVMPAMATMSEYQAAGQWRALTNGKAAVQVDRRADIKTYAVFIAMGIPDKMHPVSAVQLVEG